MNNKLALYWNSSFLEGEQYGRIRGMNLDFLYDVIPGLENDIEDAVEYEDEGFYYDAIDKWYLILEKYKLATEITQQIYFKTAYLYHLIYEEDVESDEKDNILRNLIALYDIILFFNPRDLEARFLRGSCYAETGDQDKAIKDLDAYIAVDKNYFAPFLERGISKSNIGDLKGALEDLNMAVKLKPDSSEARINRGGRLVDTGKYEEAIVDFEKAIELDNEDAEPYLNKLELLIITEKWEELPNMLVYCREVTEAYGGGIFTFLEAVAEMVLKKIRKPDAEEIYNRIKGDVEEPFDWNFEPIKEWMSTTDSITASLRKILIKLTSMVEEAQENS